MRDKNTQFVNNIPPIINRNAVPSKNIATLVLNRQNINVDEDDCNSGNNNNNNNNNSSSSSSNNNNNYQIFLQNNSLNIFHQNIRGLKHTIELVSSLHSDLLHINSITDITSIN